MKLLGKEFSKGKKVLNDPAFKDAQEKSRSELNKRPTRTDIINYLLSKLNRQTTYLEIGVRNPNDNHAHIKADKKYGVDPGVEFKDNPVSFQLTSDDFFTKLDKGEILDKGILFDVVFIDGLHLAEQVDRDIINCLRYLKDDGFIVMHDCSPPTEWHARENYAYKHSPAGVYWNGTTWKAFVKWRHENSVHSCCIDTDWGVGVIAKNYAIGNSITGPSTNPFYEFDVLDKDRKTYLNLMKFEDFKAIIDKALPGN
ncbi:class I SAM-dependent methyltransferase [Flavobacterium sp. DGU11]|uniref:Class I SAM-dependent methyltransferase n=1 Tax=Flavobacterium arundinis TaxID=3139143 RepID=A0ABU9HW89_9FLAO